VEALTRYQQIRGELANAPRKWLSTGAAVFIGSNLTQALLELDQLVVGFDNFATGHPANLREVERRVAPISGAASALLMPTFAIRMLACKPVTGSILSCIKPHSEVSRAQSKIPSPRIRSISVASSSY